MVKSNSKKRRVPPASVTPDEPLIIEILDSDDEIQRQTGLDEIRKRITSTTKPSTSKSFMEIEITDDDDDNDDDGGGKIGAVCPLRQIKSNKRVKTEGPDVVTSSTTHSNNTSESSEIQIVSRTEPALKVADASERAGTGANEDIEVIGTKGTERLPHMRQHCPEHEFIEDVVHCQSMSYHVASFRERIKKGLNSNKKHCDMCFCYVCDVPVKDCKHWESEDVNFGENHCLASDKGRNGFQWKQEREKKKNGPISTEMYSSDDDDEDYNFARHLFDDDGDYFSFLNHQFNSGMSRFAPVGPGPFDPTKATEREIQKSSKCRKCGWYSRLVDMERPGEHHWCHACGRICRDTDFGTRKGIPYTKQYRQAQRANDIALGTKTISFTIHPHDPRKLDKYKQKWAKYEGQDGWHYNEEEMCQDFFNYRFGEWPQIAMILESIPVVSEESIPDTLRGNNKASNTEAEYILLQSKSDKYLLEEVGKISTIGKEPSKFTEELIRGDVRATLDKTKRKGTFSIRLYLKLNLFNDSSYGVTSLPELFGAWFGVTPFDLSSLARGCKAVEREPRTQYQLQVPPFRLRDIEQKILLCEYEGKIRSSINSFNAATKNFRSELSFTCSVGKYGCGGVADNGTDFSSLLKRYFSETIIDEILHSAYGGPSWCDRAKGVLSYHRSMRNRDIISGSSLKDSSIAYVRDEDRALAMDNLKLDTPSSHNLNTLMQMLENLGHTPCPHTDGLNVELLEYQKQTVQWALERETKEGGLESFFWAKIPNLEKTIYFNPMLNKLSQSKPRHVRGGIIAEEMGLGKTVISLALILHNPAPLLPKSGSCSSAIPATSNESWNGKGWDPVSSKSSTGKGDTLSRGTLVICHVSLVGQWIDEAKSKLTEPGLVYPYHGGNRKRDARILASHSVVVTTYATLASDKFFHSKKGGKNYVPPCEKVRWWRIICDESHSLRDGATQKTKAVMDLVGDHRWCVSGTPMNTGIRDLKMQLKFVGLDGIEKLLYNFENDIHLTDLKKKRSCYGERSKLAPFLFYMRQVMMRHTKKQNYTGTNTALMSLPEKVERIVNVSFSKEEEKEYKRLERDAITFYESFKQREGHQLSKHYLVLYQKLTPLRIACSGGGIPEETEIERKKKDFDVDDGESQDGESGNDDSKSKKKIKISDVVFNSKLSVLVKELQRIRDEEPHAKSLIFSQFTSTLKFLQSELPKHGFDFRTLSGDMSMKKRAKALHDFQTDPPTTIFLLSMRAGAVGINLTQANRVFILEPAFNPALEAQAIGRVHRMGQKHKVEIIRFIMENSIETRLRRVLEKKYGVGAASAKASASGQSDSDKDNSSTENTCEEPEDQLDKSKATGVASLDEGVAIVGSIRTDRTTVLTAEFDELFGSVTGVPTPDTHMSTHDE